MDVVQVHFHTFFQLEAHESEALGSETIALVEVASIPLDSVEDGPRIIGDRIEATAKRHAA